VVFAFKEAFEEVESLSIKYINYVDCFIVRMVTINLDKRGSVIAVVGIVFLIGMVYALATAPNPGHSSVEVGVSIPGQGDMNLQDAIDGGYLSGGGGGGGTTLPSCSSGQVVKWSGSAWACSNDIDTNTDTKCSTPGSCSQICVGSDCKSSWVGVSSYGVYCDCDSSGYGCTCYIECATGFGLTVTNTGPGTDSSYVSGIRVKCTSSSVGASCTGLCVQP